MEAGGSIGGGLLRWAWEGADTQKIGLSGWSCLLVPPTCQALLGGVACGMPEEKKPDFKNDPLFQEVLREGLAIQHRFSAAPVYAKTGKGYLKSEGVEELKRLKEAGRDPK